MKIAMTSVFVENPVKAYDFYTKVLGFKGKVFKPEHFIAIVASPEEEEGTQLLLEPNGNPVAKNYQEGLYNSNIPCIIFTVENLEATHKELVTKGVRFVKEPTRGDWGLESVFDDGFGNYILLMQEE